MKKDTAQIEVPDYLSIATTLCKEISAGVYAEPDSFPSLTRIMKRFGVSRPSAVRSVAELKRQGLVASIKGSRTFVLKKNRKIGLAIPGTADSDFFTAVMDGLVNNCQEAGMEPVVGDIFAVNHSKRDRQAERLARHFVALGVAGVIMQPVGFSENADRLNGIIADMLDKAHIPVVLVDYDIAPPPERSRYDVVSIDNFNAGRKMAAHLMEVGARRICCLFRRLCADSVRTRFAGVETEVRRARGWCRCDTIVAEPDDVKAVASALEKFRPDAIVCSNDIAASILAKTLKKLHVRIPGDILLAGFDDVREAARMKPRLTSMKQPCRELADTAFRTLMERMANPLLQPRKILLDTALVIRESTGGGARL